MYLVKSVCVLAMVGCALAAPSRLVKKPKRAHGEEGGVRYLSALDFEPANPEVKKQLADLKASFLPAAQDVLAVHIPAAILDLKSLYETKQEKYKEHLNIPYAKFAMTPEEIAAWEGTTPLSPILHHESVLLSEKLLPISRNLEILANWLALQNPEIEAGDNFGVEVLAESNGLVQEVEKQIESTAELHDDLLSERAKSLTDMYHAMVKLPENQQRIVKAAHIEAFIAQERQAFADVIEKYIQIYTAMVVLQDNLMKNMSKLLAPRSGHGHRGYN